MVRPMPRHDPDAIAALAEGRLDPEEAATLEREIAADPIAATQLAELRIALEAAAEAVRPELTVSERSDLRAAVADALGITTPDAVSQTVPGRVPWGSLGIAAAALAGLIAVVPVVGLLSTGGADDLASFPLAGYDSSLFVKQFTMSVCWPDMVQRRLFTLRCKHKLL